MVATATVEQNQVYELPSLVLLQENAKFNSLFPLFFPLFFIEEEAYLKILNCFDCEELGGSLQHWATTHCICQARCLVQLQKTDFVLVLDRASVMRLWLQETKDRQTTQLWVQHMHVHWRNRQLLKHFSSWLVYTEACRYPSQLCMCNKLKKQRLLHSVFK